MTSYGKQNKHSKMLIFTEVGTKILFSICGLFEFNVLWSAMKILRKLFFSFFQNFLHFFSKCFTRYHDTMIASHTLNPDIHSHSNYFPFIFAAWVWLFISTMSFSPNSLSAITNPPPASACSVPPPVMSVPDCANTSLVLVLVFQFLSYKGLLLFPSL